MSLIDPAPAFGVPNAFLSARKCRLGAGQIADKLLLAAF
jgi:hypothetical protein